MAYSNELFSEQLDQVKVQFQDLSTTLEEVCENLKGSDSPPASEIMEEIINSANKIFEELKSCVIEWAKSVQLPDIPDAQELDSIKAITTLSENIMAHQDRVQNEKVLEYISRARSIKYAKEGEPFLPLEHFRSNLDKLKKRVSTPPISDEGQNERTQILKNRHPINGVLTLLEHGDELDQESYDQISEIISEQYGHSFMIATVRGSLIPPEIPDPKGPQPSPDTEEESEEPEPKGADDLPVDGQAKVQQEEIPEEPPTVKTQKESDASETESAEDLPVDGQAPVEVKKEKTESKDVPAKDVITELKEEIDTDLPPEDVSIEPVFCFGASETAQSIAAALSKSTDGKLERGFPDLFWALIQEKRLNLAYWLARYVENKELDLPFTIPSHFVEALIHGLGVQNNTGSSAGCLVDIYNREKFEFLESEKTGYEESIRLLIVSGTLRPSLLAPHTGAYTFLKSLTPLPGLDAFFAIGQAVEKFAAAQVLPIITDNLTDAKDDQQWQGELDSLITDAKNWLSTDKNMRNPQLAQIWQDYLSAGKLVHNLVSPVVNNNEPQIEKVSQMIKDYNSDQKVRTRARADANQAANKAFNDDFRYSTNLLETGIREAVDFASRWVKLYDQRPKQDYSKDLSRTLRLQDEIQQHADTARDQLNVFAEQYENFKPILASVEIAQQVLKAITGLFNEEKLSTEDDERVLLSAELLKIPNLELTEKWMPTEEMLDNLGRHLVQHIALPEPDQTWMKAFEKQTEHRNHWATKHILDLMATTMDDETVSKLEEARQEAIGQCITALENDIETTQKEIESSILNDILTDQERSDFSQQIEGIDPKKILNFGPEHCKLKAIRNDIKYIHKKRLDECRKQLEKLSMSEDDIKKIDAVLDRGDVGTAEGFIAIHEKGEPLLDPDEDNRVDQFQDFFPKAVKELEELFRTETFHTITSRIKKGQSIGPINMDEMSDDQKQDIDNVLDTWAHLKNSRTEIFSKRSGERIGRILKWLGLEAQDIGRPKRNRTGSRVWIPLKATVSYHCPIPSFGSESNGQYRLMCVWDQSREDEILDWINQDNEGQATIVFYFNRMTIQERQDLARSTRASCPPFLLIDENQLLFLCNERGARLPTLFDCAMPFTYINPYTPFSPGNVPPEMFFGREQEADSLMDPNDSCIIYGGRQLGKTALLRYVEREFENKSGEHKAIYLDLKANGIPEPNALWPALGKCLREKGIIPRRASNKDLLIDRINRWIKDRPNRRILLLLDESDEFLEEDAKDNFPDVLKLKGLMDRTRRKFKLIFAGLHNVQRFSAIPNQPLAHLGKPISIGPLTTDAAQNLILKPLRTLGYRFDDLSFVATILFQMNSYPNLIQLFCNELLKYLRKQPFSTKNAPPYRISKKHIEEVYQSQDLRATILERFKWTLDLDKRYRFIAYKIAYEIRAGAGEKGFEVNWIANEACQDWPEGFGETIQIDEIRGLLDEMIGLGILVKTENNQYRLRSPNVLRLLGTVDQIEGQLIEILQYPPSPGFDPNSFRRRLKDKNQCSPLTAEQESDILKSENDIRLIFGSEGLGIESVPEGVKAAVADYTDTEQVHLLDANVQSPRQLRSWLQEHIRGEGYVIPIVPLEKAGSEPKNLIEWTETSLYIVARRRSEKRIIRILFVVPPQASQIWFRIPIEKRKELTNAGGRLLLLKRWNDAGLRRWLEDFNIAPNEDAQRKEILDTTGGWPIFIKKFTELCQNDEGMNWTNAIQKIREIQQNIDDALRQGFCEKFGLIQMDRANHVWTTLCKWYPIELSELQDEIENMPPENLLQIVDYFDYLKLLEPGKGEQICPEPVAAAMTLEG